MRGFTLIEVMIVVAIIGIVTVVAIPRFRDVKVRAMNSVAKSDNHNGMSLMISHLDY